jgi:hypothetical protein
MHTIPQLANFKTRDSLRDVDVDTGILDFLRELRFEEEVLTGAG